MAEKPTPIARKQDNAADEKGLSALERLARRHERERIAGLKQTMSGYAGRQWTWELLEYCGIYRTSFTGNSETFFREGQRSVGLKLLADIHEHCLPDYEKMALEAKARDVKDDEELKAAELNGDAD